ncbi:MAG: tetratricopeptide repeat protein, partial [Chloroflexota bacterium]
GIASENLKSAKNSGTILVLVRIACSISYLQSEYLKRLPQYNGLIVHWDMFDESMFKLRRQFLGERLDEDNTIISREQMYTTEYRTIDIEVQSIFEQGVQHFQRADWHNAIETFNKAIAKDSLFSEAYFYLGRSYWNIDENIKSSESYLKAVEVDPTHPQINMMRARLKLSLGEYADALIYASLFLIDNLKFAEAHFTFGHIVADMKKYEEAIKFYNQAVKLQESHVSSYFNLGFCYKALKNYPLAIENYSKALKFVPQYLEVYNNRGIIYMIIGEFSKASQDFRKMLVIDPDSELAEKNLRLLEYYKRRRSVF